MTKIPRKTAVCIFIINTQCGRDKDSIQERKCAYLSQKRNTDVTKIPQKNVVCVFIMNTQSAVTMNMHTNSVCVFMIKYAVLPFENSI